jgi:hypothetical protein
MMVRIPRGLLHTQVFVCRRYQMEEPTDKFSRTTNPIIRMTFSSISKRVFRCYRSCARRLFGPQNPTLNG